MPEPARADVVLERSRALSAALQTLAETLTAADAAAVLDCESLLRAAVVLPDADATLDADHRARLREEIARARMALVRCRALGIAHARVTDATLTALGRHGGYGPFGSVKAPGPSRGADVRVRA